MPRSVSTRRLLGICLTLLATALPAAALTSQEEAKLVPVDAAPDDWVGGSTAVFGDTALVGAFGDDDLGILSGSAYVYTRGAGGWSEAQKLHAGNGAIGCRFGWSAALEGDTAVIGALFGNGTSAATSGTVHVFTRSGGTWTETAMLSGGALADWFGYSLALSGDTLAVGAPQSDDLGPDSGSVHVYGRSGSAWVETAVLHGADTAAGDHFGQALSLVGDRLVVGAPEDADAGASTGSAYVFDRVGGAWIQRSKLLASDAASSAWFGSAVHTDGTRVAVGAYQGDDPVAGPDVGSVYVFSEAGGVWSEDARIVASDATPGDEFGWSVHLSGSELLVGSDQRVGRGGAVYRFIETAGSWSEREVFVASDETPANLYGWSLARDGATLLVGARDAQSAHGKTGAAYVIALDATIRYCFGDGSGAACPCGNAGGAGEGCANSSGAGAVLAPAGTASVAADDLAFQSSGLLPNQPALLFAGQNAVNGGAGAPFGDGLRCAGGGVKRLGVRVPDPAGAASWGPGLAAQGGWAAGDVRRFQVWYRDPAGSPCGTGFNLSNGVEVVFAP